MDSLHEPFDPETWILRTGVGTPTKARTFRPKDKADEDSEYIGSELPDSKAQRKRKMNEDSDYIGSELPDSKAQRRRKRRKRRKMRMYERAFRGYDNWKIDEDSEYIGSELPDSKAQRKRKMNEDSDYVGSELPDSKAQRTRKMDEKAYYGIPWDSERVYHYRKWRALYRGYFHLISTSEFPHYERIKDMFTEDKDAVEQTLGQRKNYKDKRNQRDEYESFINLKTNSSEIRSLVTDAADHVKYSRKAVCSSAVRDITVISMKEMSKLPEFVRPQTRRKLDKANDEIYDEDSFTSPIVFSVTDEMIKEWSSSELSYFQKFGIYIIPETSKSIRATICFLLERPIAEQLEDLHTQVKVEKADVINDYIAQLKTKRETRSTSGFMSKLKDQEEEIDSFLYAPLGKR